MQNRQSGVTKVEVLNDPNHQLASCIRLSPYKKWTLQDNSRYRISNLCAVYNMDSSQYKTSGVNIRNGSACGGHTVASATSKESVLYEPYTTRTKNNISVVNCKHSPAKDESRVSKTDFSRDSELNHHHDYYMMTRHSPSKSGYANNGYKSHFTTSLRIDDLCENTSPSPDMCSGLNFLERQRSTPVGDFIEKSPTNRKILEESFIDGVNYAGQHNSGFRKVLDKSQGMVKEVRNIKPAYNIGVVEVVHQNAPSNHSPVHHHEKKNIKCGNASCNGSEPLKETHITNTDAPSPVKPYSANSSFNIEKRYRDQVATWNGKIKELPKSNHSTPVKTVRSSHDNDLKERKSFGSVAQPRTPVRKMALKRNSPTNLREDHKVNSGETKASKAKIGAKSESPEHKGVKNAARKCSSPELKESKMTLTADKPQLAHLTTDCAMTELNETKNSQTVFHARLASGADDNHMSIPIEGVVPKTPVLKELHRSGKKAKRKVKTDMHCSGSETELSDSECSGPDEAVDEDKHINYETVLNELASIRHDLSKFSDSIVAQTQESIDPSLRIGSGDTSSNKSSIMRASLFPYVPPYLKFSSHDVTGPKLPTAIQRQLKWKFTTITPIIVRKTLTNSGFRIIRAEDCSDWIGIWGKHMKAFTYKDLKENQKMNHFPGTFQIGRKDRLWRNTQRLQIKSGFKEFDYVPKSYILPKDFQQLKQAWQKGEGVAKWIIKPPASSRGAGIRVVNRWNQIPKKHPLVVQRYIENPYLINGSKFDLRLYVLVTSFDPIRVYLYPDGLVRFASVKYSLDSSTLDNRYMHLTNYSINKLSRDYTANEDAGACQGHKWTIQTLWDYFRKNGINTELLWTSLQDVIIKTIISGQYGITELSDKNVSSRYNCYELFGIDILLDEKLKPWVLEVNISPSLHSTSPLDMYVKGPLVQTVLNMAQYHIPHDSLQPQQRHRVIKTLGLHSSKNQFMKSTSPPPVEGRKMRSKSTSSDDASSGTNDAAGGAGDDVEDVPLCLDPRLYTKCLSPKERTKQIQMATVKHRHEYLQDILINLTPDDIRMLIVYEDELQAAGKFEKIFPTKTSYNYLKLIEPRYYDRLFDAWETKYGSNRSLGISLLQAYCSRKYHLTMPPPDKLHKESSMDETNLKTEEKTMTTPPMSRDQPSSLSRGASSMFVNSVSSTMFSTNVPSSTEGPSPSRKIRTMRTKQRHIFDWPGVVLKKYSRVHYPISRRMYRIQVKRKS